MSKLPLLHLVLSKLLRSGDQFRQVFCKKTWSQWQWKFKKRDSPVLQRSTKKLESGHRCCINKEHNAAMTDSSFADFVSRTYNPSSATSNAGFTCKLLSLPAAPAQGIASWEWYTSILTCSLCVCWGLLRLSRHLTFHEGEHPTLSKTQTRFWKFKKNPLIKNNGHWSTTPPRKRSHLKLCSIADSHWWLKLASAEQCWQRN